MAKKVDLVQGTLEMLILKTVSLGRLHGYGILLRIQQMSRDQLVIQQGSLYPALYRLEHEGKIKSEWGEREQPPSQVLHTHGCADSLPKKRRSGTEWARSSVPFCG
jgi:DNA-binding PadR family transcriptional regulator